MGIVSQFSILWAFVRIWIKHSLHYFFRFHRNPFSLSPSQKLGYSLIASPHPAMQYLKNIVRGVYCHFSKFKHFYSPISIKIVGPFVTSKQQASVFMGMWVTFEAQNKCSNIWLKRPSFRGTLTIDFYDHTWYTRYPSPGM